MFVQWCLFPHFLLQKSKSKYLGCKKKKYRRTLSGAAVPRGCWARSVPVGSAQLPEQHTHTVTLSSHLCPHSILSPGRVLHAEPGSAHPALAAALLSPGSRAERHPGAAGENSIQLLVTVFPTQHHNQPNTLVIYCSWCFYN